MLVLSRRPLEDIHISVGIIISVIAIQGDKVRLGITAPKGVAIYRGEIVDRLTEEHRTDLTAERAVN